MPKNHGLTQRQVDVILAMADTSMRTNEVAERLQCTRNTVHYNIESIRQKTGLDAKVFHDLMRLVIMLKDGYFYVKEDTD